MSNNRLNKKRARFAVLEILLYIVFIGFLNLEKSLVANGEMPFYPDYIRAQEVASVVWIVLALALAIYEIRRQNREEPQPSYTPEEGRKRLIKLTVTAVVTLAITYGISYLLCNLGVLFSSIDDVNEFVMSCVVVIAVIFTMNVVWISKQSR